MVVVTISTLVTQLLPVEMPPVVRSVVLLLPEEPVSLEEDAKSSSPRSDLNNQTLAETDAVGIDGSKIYLVLTATALQLFFSLFASFRLSSFLCTLDD